MSILHVRQIQSYLEKNIANLIDISDVEQTKKSNTEKETIKISRCLAAFAVMISANTSLEEASKSVTDGFDDNGLDAVFFEKKEKVLYLVQAKWSKDGTGTIDVGEVRKFLDGFNDLLYLKKERFNQKIQSRFSEIQEIIENPQTKFVLVIIYSGSQDIPDQPKERLNDFLENLNDTNDIVSSRILRQSEIHKIISKGLNNDPIDVEIMLNDWGQTGEPYQAYYGQVSAKSVALWWNEYSLRLFSPNIRVFLGNTEINENIVNTLKEEPQKFWYYNNGITALCSSINKKHVRGSDRKSGVFDCKDIRIVNGAQTVGSVANAFTSHPEQVEKANIPIRLISLENCPEEFSTEVTRYNNTQNRIDRRDFVSLDPEQERIKTELALEGIIYVYKSGELIPQDKDGFNLDEATIALACRQQNIALAVRAKDKIGTLWDDISKAPYKQLFNSGTNSIVLWKSVQITRVVEDSLIIEHKNEKDDPRRRLFAIHGSKLILHFIFKDDSDEKNLSEKLSDAEVQFIQHKTKEYLDDLTRIANDLYPDSYPANICRNITKSQEISEMILS